MTRGRGEYGMMEGGGGPTNVFEKSNTVVLYTIVLVVE